MDNTCWNYALLKAIAIFSLLVVDIYGMRIIDVDEETNVLHKLALSRQEPETALLDGDCAVTGVHCLSERYPSQFTRQPVPTPPLDKGWLHEMPVVSRTGEPLGTHSTWDVHTKGLWHRDVFIALHVIPDSDDDKGGLLIQKRARWKWAYPGLWDMSASETMEAHESYETAARRAVAEEMEGLVSEKDLKLQKCCGTRATVWEGDMPFFRIRDKSLLQVFRCEVPSSSLNKTGWDASGGDPEVIRWRLADPSALKKESLQPNSKVGPWMRDVLAECSECFD